MNKKQLLEELEQFNDTDEIYFSYNYGDHCHHWVVIPVSFVQTCKVEHSSYTDSLVKVYVSEYDDEEELGLRDTNEVCVLQ
jgi:hypothetical protein